MTMLKREQTNIWSLVREDRDIDDIIFASERAYQDENDDRSDR